MTPTASGGPADDALSAARYRDLGLLLRRNAILFETFADELAQRLAPLGPDRPRCPAKNVEGHPYVCRLRLGHPGEFHVADPLELDDGIRSFMWSARP